MFGTPQRHPGLAGGNHLETAFGTSQRHHPHFDRVLPHKAVRSHTAYKLRVCGNELDGFCNLTIRCGEVGSFDALLEILEERLAVGVITSLAIQKAEPPEGGEEDPFEEVTTLEDLPSAPATALLRIKSKCTGAKRYPTFQSYHLHPYTLHHAAAAGETGAMQELIENGANIDGTAGYSGRTALHSASAAGRPLAVQALLETSATKGSDRSNMLHGKDVAGLNPLHDAARYGHIEVVVHLLSADFDPAAVADQSHNHTTSSDSLTGMKPIIHSRSKSGATPLHEAARAGHADVVSLLLRAGAETASADESGRTSLHWAAAGGHLEAVTELLQASGAATFSKSAKGSVASLYKSPQASAGTALVHIADRRQVTPLHLACGCGHAEVVSVLLDHGADVAALDLVGLSPAGWAQKHRHPHVLRRLLSAPGISVISEATGAAQPQRAPAGAASSFSPASIRMRHELTWATEPPPSYIYDDGEKN